MKKKESKVAIITGGGTGIGKAIALRFAEHNFTVFCCGRRESKLIDIASNYENIIPFTCDVREISSIEKFTSFVKKSVGYVDVLINNAGYFCNGGILELNKVDLENTFKTNIEGPIWVTYNFLPLIKKSKYGRIINISSAVASTTLPNHYMLIYSISKAALIKFTEELARELAVHNICVNSISPGVIETDMGKSPDTSSEERTKEFRLFDKLHPLGRCGTPEEIADLVYYISSEGASWITGIDIRIDGGLGVK